MKFTGQTSALVTTVALARRAVDSRAKSELLKALLIQADGDSVVVTGSALDFDITSNCAVNVQSSGNTAVPVAKLWPLLEATNGDAEITIESIGTTVVVRTGPRSLYRLPALPPTDFPATLTPKGALATFTLNAADTAALFSTPLATIGTDTTRIHLCGVFLHALHGKLAAAATDGIRLLLQTTAVAAGDELPTNGAHHGIIVPSAAATEIARLGGRDGVTLATDGRVIEARAAGTRFASKLIDGTFPDYGRLLPPPAATTADFDSAEMCGALARLAAVSGRDDDRAAVGLIWNTPDVLSLCLANEDGTASDTLTAPTSGTARVACSAAMFSGLIESIGTKRVRLSIEDKPGAALRLDAPEDRGVVAIVAPIYWTASPRVDEAAA